MESKEKDSFSLAPYLAVCALLCLGAVPGTAQVAGCGGPGSQSFTPTRRIQQQMTFGQTSWLDQALCGLIYYLPPDTLRLPDLSQMRPVGTIYARELNLPVRNFDEGFPGITNRFEWFAIEYHGWIRAGRKGSYSLRLFSDDGSKLFIDSQLIIDNDGQHAAQSASGSVYLDDSEHAIRVQYFQGPRFQIALQLFCTPEGGQERLFPDCGIQLETPREVRTSTDSRLVDYEFVDTEIHYGSVDEADCRPSKVASRCTPPRAVVDAKAWGQYHVLLPAQLAVGIPNPGNLPLIISNAEGSVCWDTTLGGNPLTGGLASDHVGCNGPEGGGHVQKAGAGFLMPDKRPGALILWTSHGTTFFAVNGRIGNLSKDANGLSRFNGHEGAFAFDAQAAPPSVLGSLSGNPNVVAERDPPVQAAVTPYMVPINPAKETWTIIKDSGNRKDLEKFASVYSSSEFRAEALSRASQSRSYGSGLPTAFAEDNAVRRDARDVPARRPEPTGVPIPNDRYARGLGRPVDEPQVNASLEKACDAGDLTSCNRVGTRYRLGIGTGRRDYSRALAMFQKSCEGAFMEGCADVAFMYANGFGVQRDDRHANSLYLDACNKGAAGACGLLGAQYALGRGVKRSFTTSADLYRRGCEGGDAAACGALGTMVYYGYDQVPPNRSEGLAFLQKGCNMGHQWSCQQLIGLSR